MASPNDPLTEELIAALLAIYSGGRITTSMIEAISRVAAAIIEEEVRQATALLSIDYSIDPVALALEWVDMMPTRIGGISAVTKERINGLLLDALANGDSIADVGKSLFEMFNQIDAGRAIVIARTEVLGATNFATWRSYVIANVPFKRWISTMDDRVRDTHAAAHRQIRGIMEAFSIGGSPMMYPGDPDGPAKEVINCRCAMLPEMLSRSTIWAMERIRAIWSRYVQRTVNYDKLMVPAVQEEFKSQYLLLASVLHRYSQ